MANYGEKVETVTDFIFLGSKITVDAHCSLEIKILALGRRAMTNLDSIFKNREITFADKCPYSQNYGISSSHVWMWELDHKEGWAPKNWCLEEVGNLPEKEFRILIVKMIQNLEIKMESQINRLETRIEKMQERFNKDLEEIKTSQYIMNNAF